LAKKAAEVVELVWRSFSKTVAITPIQQFKSTTDEVVEPDGYIKYDSKRREKVGCFTECPAHHKPTTDQD